MLKLVRLYYDYFFFQIPYYWPCSQKNPDNVEYAIYLSKRLLRNKQRHALEDYEMVNTYEKITGIRLFRGFSNLEHIKINLG